jgi:dTDP-glucose 4,6-dehydratase
MTSSSKRILVTGAGGFIGSHLTELCIDKGYDVTAFVRYNSKNNWGWLENSSLKNQINIIAGDIRDYDSVFNAMKKCDTVFHLAALIGIPYSYTSPLAYIKTNIEGTYNVLQVAKELKLRNVLVTSTSETYGTAKYVPIDEDHLQVGQSPYAATKIAADQIALSFYRSFNLPVKIVRPFNTYGPRQSARAIIPTIITQILNGGRVIKLGNLHATRDLTYVKDTINGFLKISECDDLNGEVTNVGMNHEISVSDLALTISNIMDVKIEIDIEKERIRPEKSEVERLKCDNRKLCSKTNWKAKYDIDSGLKETIDWLKNNISYYKPELYTI